MTAPLPARAFVRHCLVFAGVSHYLLETKHKSPPTNGSNPGTLRLRSNSSYAHKVIRLFARGRSLGLGKKCPGCGDVKLDLLGEGLQRGEA